LIRETGKQLDRPDQRLPYGGLGADGRNPRNFGLTPPAHDGIFRAKRKLIFDNVER